MISYFIIIIILITVILLVLRTKKIKRILRISKVDEEKILSEDILKLIYNQSYQYQECDEDSLFKKINKPIIQLQQAINKLVKADLVSIKNNKYSLTEDGEKNALKVIRKHRLYEKYLADETNENENNWHRLADDFEHSLSNEEIDKLAAQIGNPVFDPHGDPIPTEKGELPKLNEISLLDLKTNDIAIVTHLEDEPDNLYSNCINKGIHEGVQIKFLGIHNDEVVLYINDKLCTLTLDEAKNIYVGLPKLEKIYHGNLKKLSTLKVGEKAKIIGIAKSLRGQQRRRLMDLGIVPETKIEVELESMTGNPIAYKIRGTIIALRKNQTDKIFIEIIE